MIESTTFLYGTPNAPLSVQYITCSEKKPLYLFSFLKFLTLLEMYGIKLINSFLIDQTTSLATPMNTRCKKGLSSLTSLANETHINPFLSPVDFWIYKHFNRTSFIFFIFIFHWLPILSEEIKFLISSKSHFN